MEHEVRSNYSEELIHGTAAVTALVGAALLKQAMRGDVNASRFWLQSRAKWTIPQHVELTGRDGGPVEVEHRRALVARVLALATPNKVVSPNKVEAEQGGSKTETEIVSH
jgi:hypothetical protein